jgi:predicted nucleic acid-binding protein
VHAEPESDRWRAAAARWLREQRPVVVPQHFWLEISNVLLTRHGYDSAAVLEALHVLDDLVTETAAVDRPSLLLAIDRAERLGLSIYDAAYLALAESIDAELATMDRALEAAAGSRLVRIGAHRRLSEEPAPYGSPQPVSWPDYTGAASYLASLRAELRRRQAERTSAGGAELRRRQAERTTTAG